MYFQIDALIYSKRTWLKWPSNADIGILKSLLH